GKGRAMYLASPGGRQRSSTRRLTEALRAAGIRPPFSVHAGDDQPASGVETYVFTSGGLTIVAMQRDYRVSSGSQDTAALELELPRPLEVYDIRGERPLGKIGRVQLEL